jgi:glutamate-ammonia-ligase adenylyltransferase
MHALPNTLVERAQHELAEFKMKLESATSKLESVASKGSTTERSENQNSNNENAQNQEGAIRSSYFQLLETHSADIIRAFALSDFISRTAQLYPIAFMRLLPELVSKQQHDGQSYSEYFEQLQSKLMEVTDEAALHAALRQFRHLKMLAIAWRDLLYKADIKHSLLAISHLADVLINSANAWLYTKACERYGEPTPVDVNFTHSELNNDGPRWEPQELIVIGMGKLGGRELNFSSDIDLIFVYPESGETNHSRKPIDHQSFFTRLAQKLIAALHQTTIDGQVYRVDMRLRPLGESGPLVVSMPAFESYYLEQGREWERFAMQKARIINPDSGAVRELRSIIIPFVYRKYLDFTTIESLRNMKQLISNEVARRNLSNNIKLGRGGIREVEFFVQSLQMIHAGKVTECQRKSILDSFAALVEHQFLSPKDANELQESYLFLRKVEHYLQAFDDKQTQQLPSELTDHIDHQRLMFLLDNDIGQVHFHMKRINAHFMLLIEESNEEDNEVLNQSYSDLWSVSLDNEEMTALFLTLLTPHIADSEQVAEKLSAQLIEFKNKCTKHVIGQKGRNTLSKLIPQLLDEVLAYDDIQIANEEAKEEVSEEAEQKSTKTKSHANELFERIFDILLTIVGRTAYLDLLLENPPVRERLITLSANSHWVAKQIKAFPLLLDELLQPAYLRPDQIDIATWHQEYENELRLQLLRVEPDDVEAQMDALRYFKLTQQLRIAAADISGTLPINNVSDKLTVLAEVLLGHAIDIAWQQMVERYGAPEGYSMQNKGLGVIAYGKLGGIELGYGSDLDIVFVHDIPLSTKTTGEKSLSCSEFFVKLVQRITHIFTTKTYLNDLYEIDLRLRPSGNSGLLISHIDSFANYQANDAWTWEHQALVRARYVYGHDSLRESFTQIRQQILAKKRDADELRKEVADMREKMRVHLDKSDEHNADLKQTSGGITDLEFLTQYWVLRHANEFSELSKWSDNLRILDSLAEVNVISQEQNETLQEAYLFIRNQLHKLSLGAFGTNNKVPNLDVHMSVIQRTYASVFADET